MTLKDKILAILNADLAPWVFDGSEPIAERIVNACGELTDFCTCGHQREAHHILGKCHGARCKCTAFVLSDTGHDADLSFRALRLAKEATNGWGCYAQRDIEHENIALLHREIAAIEQDAGIKYSLNVMRCAKCGNVYRSDIHSECPKCLQYAEFRTTLK